MHLSHSHRSGFSLIELSIVLVIIGLMVGGIMSAMNQDARQKSQKDLNAKMDAIENALMDYVQRNGRLPCPSNPSNIVSDTAFGTEQGVAGVCSGNTNLTNSVMGGVVPVRTLAVPDDTMFDPWGGRFTYAVDIRYTASSAFINTYPTDTTYGTIQINDTAGNTRNTQSIAVILSHGPNGHGAYQFASNTRKNGGSINTSEAENCNCNSAAATGTLNTTFVMGALQVVIPTNLLNSFDDTLRYYTRGSFVSSADSVTDR
jgi:prepilin-type N-terminal cleavage/methylation domain-containing protein